MARLGITYVIFLLTLGMITCQQDPNICEMVKESCGLLLPPLPTNFIMKSELLDKENNIAMWEEMYFDNVNLRGKYMILLNGIEHHLIFDYNTRQIVQYDVRNPGKSFKRDSLSHLCTATEMAQSPYRFIFGYKDRYFETKHSRMYNSYEALWLSGTYKYAYNGSEFLSDRGVELNKFHGCFYNKDMRGTIAADYFFTNERVGPAAGTLESEVDYTAESGVLLSVPAMLNTMGTMWDETQQKNIPFNHTQTAIYFKGNPDFDYNQFQIPPYVHCENFRGEKNMPTFPTAFSARIENTTLKQDVLGNLLVKEIVSFQEVWYYNEKNIVRRDYTPVKDEDSEIYSKFGSYGPVREVYDFGAGILYVTNKASGRCYTRIIRSGDFFETSKNAMFIEMGTPEEVFQMQADDMEYKGKDYSRDIECDVWNGKTTKDKSTTYKETYISTSGWHEESDETVTYGVPVKHSVISNTKIDNDLVETITELNFFKFKNQTPNLFSFDISNCIETINHRFLGIKLDVPEGEDETIRNYIFGFLETAQYYIANIAQVMSPLRVQRTRVEQIKDGFVLSFALVDKIEFPDNPTFSQRGATLEDAITYLNKFVRDGNFVLKFYHPQRKEMVPFTAAPGNLLDLSSSFAPTSSNLDAEYENKILYDDKEEVVENKGMTPTGLGLLAIAMMAIGIAIGIAVMYLYIRKYSQAGIESQYALKNRS